MEKQILFKNYSSCEDRIFNLNYYEHESLGLEEWEYIHGKYPQIILGDEDKADLSFTKSVKVNSINHEKKLENMQKTGTTYENIGNNVLITNYFETNEPMKNNNYYFEEMLDAKIEFFGISFFCVDNNQKNIYFENFILFFETVINNKKAFNKQDADDNYLMLQFIENTNKLKIISFESHIIYWSLLVKIKKYPSEKHGITIWYYSEQDMNTIKEIWEKHLEELIKHKVISVNVNIEKLVLFKKSNTFVKEIIRK